MWLNGKEFFFAFENSLDTKRKTNGRRLMFRLRFGETFILLRLHNGRRAI